MKPYFLFISLIFTFPVYLSQSKKGFIIPDSLKNKNYEQLQKAYDKVLRIDKSKAELYVNSILSKGKKEKNYLKTADAYILLHRLKNNESALSYLDSMIVISKRQNNKSYISNGYMYKGNYFYEKGEFSKAISNYLTAKQYTDHNSETYNILSFNIGLLKLELGNYQEAQRLFLDFKKYLEDNNLTKRIDYISCLYALAYTSSKMNQLDMSDSFVKTGLEKNLGIKNKENYSNLLLVSGINLYKRKKYNLAIKTLKNVSKLVKENSYNIQNLALSEFYIGMSLYNINNSEFSNKFKIVDSIAVKTNNVTVELRDMYPLLIDYYKKNNNKNKQLFYIEHLLTVDSILNKNNHFLSNEISKKYDTPILLEKKEELITDLNNKNSLLYWFLGLGSLVIFILSYIYTKNRKKIREYQKQAELLLEKSKESSITLSIPDVEIKEESSSKEEKNKNILSDKNLQDIKTKLQQFETNKDFLQKNITVESLAKNLGTNRDYLSKSVNEFNGKNFSQYLNELRINYIVEELNNNEKIRKYTIAAIADDIGFNNSESFSNAFKKITGTLPSYYIKLLQEQSEK